MNSKVILVTGSSKGIGKATIMEFASKGYNVVINYNNSEDEAIKLKEYEKINITSKHWQLRLMCQTKMR